jgi:nucleoside-diphosphate-sugar epimerase
MIMIDKRENQQHILVTGGAGYIGSRLVGTLLDNGYFVTVIDRLDFGGSSLLGYHINPKFAFHKADVLEGISLRAAVKKTQNSGFPDGVGVIHLAATVGFPACQNVGSNVAWKQNRDAVRVVYEQACDLGVERFIFSSTYSNYGLSPDGEEVSENSPLNPQSLYAETKIAAEEYLLQESNSSCAPLIFRFATIYGTSPRMRFDLIVNQFVLEALYQEELLIYQRNYSRSFVHIQDVVDGILLGLQAAEDLVRGEIYNLGTELGNYSKEEVVRIIRNTLPNTQIQYGDHSFSGDMRDIRVSYAKIQDKLGFSARRSVKDGVEEVLGLLRSGLIEDPFADQHRNARLEIQ